MNVIITVAMLCIIFFSSMGDKKPVQSVQASRKQTVEQAPRNAVQQRTSEHTDIDRTIRYVTGQLRLNVDANGDGLSNCIDAAVLFYQHYPDKNRVSIIHNKNNITGMNHLFNSVYTDGVWRTIEPQAYYTNYNSYWMKDVWGRKYDSTYDKDATYTYSRFAK